MADTASSLTATSAAAGANPAAPNLAAVKTFLMNALSSRMSGDTAQYNLIVKQLKIREDEESVWQVLLGLNSFVSNFTQRCGAELAKTMNGRQGALFHLFLKSLLLVEVHPFSSLTSIH